MLAVFADQDAPDTIRFELDLTLNEHEDGSIDVLTPRKVPGAVYNLIAFGGSVVASAFGVKSCWELIKEFKD